MTSFVIIGGAGGIAKYHFEAIEKVGGEVVGVIDPTFDPTILSKYKITNYFPTIRQFEEYFPVDLPEYFVICSPNHLHVEHSTWALKYGDVICEKPLALNTSELTYLKSQESLGQTKVYSIAQMRGYPKLKELHAKFITNPPPSMTLRYYLPRSSSYHASWKGNTKLSGGIIFSIAIHILDFIIWTFGEPYDMHVSLSTDTDLAGVLFYKQTTVYFEASTNPAVQPERSLKFDGQNINLSSTLPLHTFAYEEIMNGHPLSISDIEPTIKLCEEIRNYK